MRLLFLIPYYDLRIIPRYQTEGNKVLYDILVTIIPNMITDSNKSTVLGL
jgi:hypothetical protein